jgi:hypothetical protein
MKEIIDRQNAALELLCKRLNENMLPAKIEDGEIKNLTILFSDLIEEDDVFSDVYFLPQKEEMNQLSFCVAQFEIPGIEDLEEENALDLCVGAAMSSANLLLGGYAVETEDGNLPVKQLVLRATLPLLNSMSPETLAAEIRSALSVMATDLTDSAPKLLALAKGQMTTDEFVGLL